MSSVFIVLWIACSALVNVGLALFFGRWIPLTAYVIEVGLAFVFLFYKSGLVSKTVVTVFFIAVSIAAISWLVGAGVAKLL
ncbi:hypothetical protein EB810_06180 [Altererythrobacter sp. FM1]|nr:hypothetical protein EB810_06180 [Altererythrobacter sp. FM1]